MPHKISKAQYDQLPSQQLTARMVALGWENCRWRTADRLLAGKGTDADLDEVVKDCIRCGHNALARELLMPPN